VPAAHDTALSAEDTSDAVGWNPNPHPAVTALRNVTLCDFEVRSRLRHMHYFHRWHFLFSFYLVSSRFDQILKRLTK
jgi:hypothetical protein